MPSNLEKKLPKYSKKTNFSREKQYAYSEDDIAKIDNKQNEWNEKRKEERTRNLKIASGDINETEKPAKPEKQKNGDYADDIIDYDDDDSTPTYSPKMTLVMHGVPLSYNMDNVMRTFQYYGDVKCLNVSSNIDSTYMVTVVPNEWNENIAEIQEKIENEGFAMVTNYKVTKADIMKE
jgi:hypothetical protein